MARLIDADAVLDRYYTEFERQDICDGSEDRDWLMKCLVEAPTLTQPNEPLTVTEVCPHCESEITMEWDVKTRGHKAVCPVCGNRLMLCDECQHGEPGHRCDYDSDTDTCRFNRLPLEKGEKDGTD